MKLLGIIAGSLLGLTGFCLLIVTIAYAVKIDGCVLLPYFVVAFLAGSYKLISKEEK